MDNMSFYKLKSIAHLLRVSGRFAFQNFNLKLFSDFLLNDPEIGIIARSLLVRYPDAVIYANTVLISQQGSGKTVPEIRQQISSFDEWVAFCIAYVRGVEINKGSKVIENFIVYVGQSDMTTIHENMKMQFYNECIEPILVYVELQIKQSLNAVYILQRYKVLCEWYERVSLAGLEETEITKKHLSKYLFDQGFTYSLSETVVPSGRIDNLALSIGLQNKTEFGSLPTAIVAEAKLFIGKKGVISDVKNQALKRAVDLGLKETYCIIFNKTKSKLKLLGVESISGFPYLVEENCRIFFVIIDLDEVFYQSKSEISNTEIDLTKH